MQTVTYYQRPGDDAWTVSGLTRHDVAEDALTISYMSLRSYRYMVRDYDDWPGGTLLYERIYEPDAALAEQWICHATTGCQYKTSDDECRRTIMRNGCFECMKHIQSS